MLEFPAKYLGSGKHFRRFHHRLYVTCRPSLLGYRLHLPGYFLSYGGWHINFNIKQSLCQGPTTLQEFVHILTSYKVAADVHAYGSPHTLGNVVNLGGPTGW